MSVELEWRAFAGKQETGPATAVSFTKHILTNSSSGDFSISVFPMIIRAEGDIDCTLKINTGISHFYFIFV